jgi:hypothetical protein
MIKVIMTIGAAAIAATLFASGAALAACPVGKDDGDTWCDNGTPWKCERCGSEYCSIIQSGSCSKDDAPFSSSDLTRSGKGAPLRYAQGDDEPQQSGQSAMEDLENAAEDGQEAVEAPTEEEAKVESGETFDTPHDADGD